MTRYDKPDEPYFMGEVIGSAWTYHRPTCHIIRQIAPHNYKRLHDWREAQELGLSPCQQCRPFSPPVQPISALGIETPTQATSASQLAPMNASQLSDRRRELIRLLDAIDPPGQRQPDEGVATRISRLSRADRIPREVGAFMRTITEMRNAAEYGAKTLSPAESAAVESAWTAVKEWAFRRGITLPGWVQE